VAGLRSVCWKTFLLFQDSAEDRWLEVLRESRSAYSALSERYLQYIKHPELLAGLSSDPLADDADVRIL
jgi:TBC1 domain family member 5